jgi:hypothetical protein
VTPSVMAELLVRGRKEKSGLIMQNHEFFEFFAKN